MNKKSYIAYREYGSEQTLCPNPIKPIKPYKKKISKVKRDFSLFKSFIFVVFGFSFFLAYSAYAKAKVFYSGEENDGWEILSYTDETVALTKEGDFTRGDKLFFVMWPYEGDCNFVDVGFFVYSEKKVDDYKYLEDKIFLIKVGNHADYEYLNTINIANHEFLNGFRSFFSIESYSINGLLRGFSHVDNIKIELTDTNESISQIIEEVGLEYPDNILVNDFFDIKSNVWNMKGFEEYLMKTISICKAKMIDADAIS